MLTVRLKEPARVKVRMKEILQVFDPSVPAFEKGYEAGRKAEYDAFWDMYLAGSCSYMFAGRGWKDSVFKPPKNIIIPEYGNTANSMFYSSSIQDMAGCLTRQGVYIDARQYNGTNGFYNWFSYSSVTHVGRILFPNNITSWNGAFTECTALHTIDELRSSANSKFSTNTFQNCTKLERMNVTGVIANNYFDIHWSTLLNKDSITSIINALSPTTSGLTVTISQTAKEAAFTADEWAALIATKPNWTISLV